MLHWIGAIAYEYQFGSDYRHYQRYTAVLPESLNVRLRDLAFDCVWADPFRLLASGDKIFSPTGSARTLQIWGSRCSISETESHGLEWLFPGLKFVYIVRNGIDAVYSMTRFISFRELPFEQMCHDWSQNALSYDHFRRKQNAIFIRFEDFLYEPEKTLENVCSQLMVDSEKGVSAFAGQMLVHPLNGPTIKVNPKSELLARAPAYTTWSDEQRNIFRQVCKNAMELHGYDIPF